VSGDRFWQTAFTESVVIDLRNLMSSGGGDVHRAIPDETLWACTMCQGMRQECPVLIGHVDLISDMRRDLIEKENFPDHRRKRYNRSVASRIPTGGLTLNAWRGGGPEVPTAESIRA
jgi:Fe-S oxidoreductase